jgi:hypothetical protein
VVLRTVIVSYNVRQIEIDESHVLYCLCRYFILYFWYQTSDPPPRSEERKKTKKK